MIRITFALLLFLSFVFFLLSYLLVFYLFPFVFIFFVFFLLSYLLVFCLLSLYFYLITGFFEL